MKLLTLLLTVFSIHAFSAGFTQERVSLSAKQVSLEFIFKEIKRQTGFVFMYEDKGLEKAKKIDVDVQDASLDKILQICFKNQPLVYTITGKIVVIQEKNISNELIFEMDTLVDIKGKVINEAGEPVAGAAIRIKDSNIGTNTNEKGEFNLNRINSNTKLQISAVNIETFEFKVNGKLNFTLTAKRKISEQDEVIISTGYEKVSKEKFVGSYAQLDSATYNRRTGMAILDRLDGMVPGVLFDKKQSTSLLKNIQIRGISSLGTSGTSQAPLIVIDNLPLAQNDEGGITNTLNAINQNDVESITILKDAAATSVYGARGGNGVIVINTKKGKYSQSLNLSMSSNFTLQEKPDLYHYPQMKSSDFIDLEIFLYSKGRYTSDINNTSKRPALSPVVEILARRKAGLLSPGDSALQIDRLRGLDLREDMNKYLYRTFLSQQHYVNLSGGSNAFNYGFSAGYNRSLTNIQNSKPDDQFTINTNIGLRPFKRMEITSGVSLSQSNSRSTNLTLPALYPYAQLADENGNTLAVPNGIRIGYLDTAGGGQLLDWKYRPLDEASLFDGKNINRSARLNIAISYKIIDWLTARFDYGYNVNMLDGRQVYGLNTYYTRNQINLYTNLKAGSNPDLRNPVPMGGILDLNNSENKNYQIRGQLNFNRNWNGSKHILSAILAGEIYQSNSSMSSQRLYGYNDETGSYKATVDYLNRYPQYLGGALVQIPISNSGVDGIFNRFVSVLANASYTYINRYTLYLSGRRDGSNIFGVNTNNRWKPLWSIGSKWNISKENFYKVNWMPSLSIRASYGYSGNVNNTLSGLTTIRYSQNLASYSSFLYAQPSTAPNPDLQWEVVKIINLGVNFSLFKNRVSGDFQFFHKKSRDLIAALPFAPSSGVTTFIVNAASLKGNGYEIQLTSKNIDGKLKWETVFGLSHARMMVTDIYRPNNYRAQDFIGYNLNPAVGRMVNGLSSYRWAGLDPANGDPQGYLRGKVTKDYQSIFIDSVDNQVFHGSSVPLYNGFFLNSISWKKFTVSANITYRLNFYFRRPALNYSNLYLNWGQVSADYALSWKNPGDEKVTNVPSRIYPAISNRDVFYQNSEINVLRGDNIRLTDIRIQYDLLNNQSKMPFVKALQLFVYANNLNLIIWRKNKSGLDPDFAGSTGFIIPTSKSWTAGVKVTF